MSIFRETFNSNIEKQIKSRQEAMINRTPDNIQYLNSRNAWIKMTSSVNVSGKPDLAKQYILQSGTLNNLGKFGTTLKSGVGNLPSDAYSTKTPSGRDNRLGIRPMPGITSMEVKSKSAYGSLREIVINFQCWDINQLEDLELLYMRPGYTVLIEWGWVPYIDNNTKKLIHTPPRYDILDKGITERTAIFKELFSTSINSGGNYDAMFGYIRNYQWSARPDGGYDCQTTVISTGEIIESLKINYVLPDLNIFNSNVPGNGKLNAEFNSQGNTNPAAYREHYERNTLAGVWAELYDKLRLDNPAYVATGSVLYNNHFIQEIPYIKQSMVAANDNEAINANTSKQIYITLYAMIYLLNMYIIPKDQSGDPMMQLDIYSPEYDVSSEYLKCLAHPIQISVDPSVCLIKNPLWYDQQGILLAAQSATQTPRNQAQLLTVKLKTVIDNFSNVWGTYDPNTIIEFKKIMDEIASLPSTSDRLATWYVVEDYFKKLNLGTIESNLNKFMGSSGVSGPNLSLLDGLFDSIKKVIGTNNLTFGNANQPTPILRTLTITSGYGGGSSSIKYYEASAKITIPLNPAAQAAAGLVTGISKAFASVEFLGDLDQDFFTDQTGEEELGYIGSIYVNVEFLYKKALDFNLESTDKKEKNEINLYKYLKSIISAIQISIGNINNFEIHVDPVDNIARIIDINYTGEKNPQNITELEVHNLESTVRSYSLQSQIFSEQSSLIAIASQAKGGQLGIQNNTMIDFNNQLTDRIIGNKGVDITPQIDNNNTTTLATSLGSIIYLLSTLSTSPPQGSAAAAAPPGNTTDINVLYSRAKNSLRDLIVYFQSITASPGANRNIIPVKFSFEMDGIGGLIIGNLFTINEDILPTGYKGDKNIGVKLAQTITGIGHSISNGDWVTKIDALNISLSNNLKGNTVPFFKLDLQALIQASFNNSFQITGASNIGKTRDLKDIKHIVLHHTDGYNTAPEYVAWAKSQPYIAQICIDRDGAVGYTTNIENRTVHADNLNDFSVGIELSNLGSLYKNSKGKWEKSPTLPLDNPARPNLNSAGVVDLGFKYNGSQYYEDFTDKQMAALVSTIKDIVSKCPNIKTNGQLNYYVAENTIYENVFGLTGGKPSAGTSVTSRRDIDSSSPSGIYVHARAQGGSHTDTHPSRKLIRALQDIKNAVT